MTRARLSLLLLLLVALGCVEAQDPVNQVQSRKADLAGGEWCVQSTVVDTAFTTDFTFVGESGQLERVLWEIQEDFLIARRAYENVAGADPEGINGTTEVGDHPTPTPVLTTGEDPREEDPTPTPMFDDPR